MKGHFLLMTFGLMTFGSAQATDINSTGPVSIVNHQHSTQSQMQDVTERSPIKPSRLTITPRMARMTRLADVAPAIAPLCSVTEFSNRTGKDLISYVTQVSSDCINKQFSVSDAEATAIFNENNMLTIINEFRSASALYKGRNEDGILNLVLFLRAGYYIQHYQKEAVGEYSDVIKQSSLLALTAFFSNVHVTDVSEEHGQVLSEVLTLVDSAGHNTHFIYIVKDMLGRFNHSWSDSRSMSLSVNSIFTILWRGQWADGFAEHLAIDNSVVDDLKIFIDQQDYLIGTSNEYLMNNAAKELGRMLNYGPSVQNKVKPYLTQLLNRYSMNGRGSGVWLAVAEMVDYYGDCNEYNICGYKQQLELQILAINYTCSPTIKIRAQSMTSAELALSCEQMAEEEVYFHTKLNTGYQPVADDHNAVLEVVIFNGTASYKQYAGTFFGISTDNGGMYLEGDPAVLGNQARFIAYEADWITDEFQVWNLKHEYVHYLDARYNIKGNFSDSSAESITWWIEGLAEYIAHGDDNSHAIEVGQNNNYQLSDLWVNSYASGNDQVYHGGYLAVRYMFEKHVAEVDNILNLLRQGNFSNYAGYMSSIGDIYNADFSDWLTALDKNDGNDNRGDDNGDNSGNNSGNNNGEDGDTTIGECMTPEEANGALMLNRPVCGLSGTDIAYYYYVEKAGTLYFSTEGGSGNADLYFNDSTWAMDTDFTLSSTQQGNNELIKADVTEGWIYLTVKSDADFDQVKLLVSNIDPQHLNNSCISSSEAGGNLTQGQAVCVSSDQMEYLGYYVEQDATLSFTTEGGDGDVELYYSDVTWASKDSFQQSSTNRGNREEITVQASKGWVYLTLAAAQTYQNVRVSVSKVR
ncbi:hypothetical protein FR932_00900 [Moritella marina ATCC 15381]|uniref:microbial collagenase n=1 Tax=Moritella marina ATCC 15381 TaxID=1202962 RepID=A0A5J6WH87_MORMI|nr:M9 family metallopeptidase [Moritella marina]QFI36481.1 hypothetical protein FR932_00900 [Moritella marina ATCC 15381]